jgi:tetratricopeptide (TPR) repeat protein
LRLKPNYETGLAFLASVFFARHNFQEALTLADRVYAFDPRALHALATSGDARLELGHYPEAEAAYQTLLEKNPSPPVFSRLARLVWLQGQPDEAIAFMQQAASEAAALGLTGEQLAWYQFQLGELYFNTGQIAAAQKQYTLSLEQFPNYYLGLVGLGKTQAAQGDFETAIEFYQRSTAIVPQPEFLAALGDLYHLTGQPDQAQQQYDTVEVIGTLAEANQQLYNRQLANFYADHDLHLAKALKLATTELEARQDIYGFDTAAWASYKNGQLGQAESLIAQAMQLGTRDAKLYYHAGMIALAQGDSAQAEHWLAEALTINPHFDFLQANIAQTTLDELRATD